MRKFVFAILAVLLPISVAAQVSVSDSSDEGGKPSRYDIFVGAGFTTQNQIVHSHGFLVGPSAGITRNFGKYFGLNAQGSYTPHSLPSANMSESGLAPTYVQILAGPELHAQVYDNFSGNVHILFGGSHTYGTGVTGSPSVAFSYGLGAALDYRLTPRFSLRWSTDHVRTANVQGNTTSGNSLHGYSNIQTAFGVVYHWK